MYTNLGNWDGRVNSTYVASELNVREHRCDGLTGLSTSEFLQVGSVYTAWGFWVDEWVMWDLPCILATPYNICFESELCCHGYKSLPS